VRLKENINDFAILVNGPPQVMLLTIDLHENFVNEESITETSVISP
jgi:hypothetical protein